MSAFIASHPSLKLMDARSEIKFSKNNDQSQRNGYNVDPYDGAYPVMGRTVAPYNPNDGLGLRLFGMGVIRPFAQALNGGIKIVNYATASVQNALMTLLGAAGIALLIQSFTTKGAFKQTAGLVALGASAYFGVKALLRAFDGQRTQAYDGDWQHPLGTSLTYGVGAVGLLGLHHGGNVGLTLKDAGRGALDGTLNIFPTLVNFVKGVFGLFKF